MAVFGVPSGPIGFVAALGFKTLDSQPEKSNMSPFGQIFMILNIFKKVAGVSWSGIYRVFGLELPKQDFGAL